MFLMYLHMKGRQQHVFMNCSKKYETYYDTSVLVMFVSKNSPIK